MLDARHSRDRQRRLLDRMEALKLDAVVIGARHHVHNLSGRLPDWRHEAGMILSAGGRSLLVWPNTPTNDAAADEVVAYEANWHGTLRQEQSETIASLLLPKLGPSRTIGVDASAVASCVAVGRSGAGVRSVEAEMHQLRRRKDPDELENLRVAMRAVDAMYARARQVIEPGVEELHVFAALHEAAVHATGEPMSAPLGNDYACGAGGGPPRKGRAARAGEIYVLDCGPTYRGYFADACRAFAVDRKPTDAQHKAWEAIAGCFPLVESMIRPGTRCRDIYRAADEHLQRVRGKGMVHHLGHGIGLQPHEFPHLNPKWDDVLLEDEIFTVEPGIYGEELRGGIRIENVYRVTASGFESLVTSTLEMT
jgi:Xaa-Pro aminopeptidase